MPEEWEPYLAGGNKATPLCYSLQHQSDWLNSIFQKGTQAMEQQPSLIPDTSCSSLRTHALP